MPGEKISGFMGKYLLLCGAVIALKKMCIDQCDTGAVCV